MRRNEPSGPLGQPGINTLRAMIDGMTAASFSACVHCGLCAEACIFYLATRDSHYTPIYKLDPMRRLWHQEFTFLGRIIQWLGGGGPMADRDLADWGRWVFTGCTLCGHCTMICPAGIDLVELLRQMREGLTMAGYAPRELTLAAQRAVATGSPMGLPWSVMADLLARAGREVGLEIPVDRDGVEFLVLFSSMELLLYPGIVGAVARILERAGVTWTVSSRVYDATATARILVERLVDEAERLQVAGVVISECGHAYQALRWDGPNLLGRVFGFKVLHLVELVDRLRQEGRLPLAGRESRPITYHDPCQLARRGGVIEEPRRLLQAISIDFRELEPHGERNWCCGGGSGMIAMEEADAIRRKAFQLKRGQLERSGARLVATACVHCRIAIEEGVDEHNLGLQVVSLIELLASHLARPAVADGIAGEESG